MSAINRGARKKRKKSRSAKKEREKSRSAGARKRERKSAKFKAQKRAQKHQREELRRRARSIKKSPCPALLYTYITGNHSDITGIHYVHIYRLQYIWRSPLAESHLPLSLSFIHRKHSITYMRHSSSYVHG
jgi:hypothetical protein